MTQDDHKSPKQARPEMPVDADPEAVLQARQDLLTHRDHVIGLEAESATLQQSLSRSSARQKAQKERIEELREKLERQRNRADRLQRELKALKVAAVTTPTGGAKATARRLLPRRDAH